MLIQDLEVLEVNYSLCRKLLCTTGKRASKGAIFAFQSEVKKVIINKLEEIKRLNEGKTISKENVIKAFNLQVEPII